MAPLDQPSLTRPRLPLRLEPIALEHKHVEGSPSRSAADSNGRIHTPSSSVPGTPFSSLRPASPERRLLHSLDSSSFLTALAAQERRVLELRDELHKAEIDLDQLKKCWAVHEATRKRNESRQLEQMEPLKFSPADTVPQQETAPHRVRDMERKGGSSRVRSSQKRVFAGSRHTRTLSLLSPLEPGPRSHIAHADQLNGLLEKQGTLSMDKPAMLAGQPGHKGLSKASADKEAILETGKQLVGDFRNGLWTFFEDLKQVTVGEENPNARDRSHDTNTKTKARTNGAASVKRTSASGTIDRAQEHRKSEEDVLRHALARLQQASSHPQPSGGPDVEVTSIDLEPGDSDEGWESWDTPEKQTSGALHNDIGRVSEPAVSPPADESGARTNVR